MAFDKGTEVFIQDALYVAVSDVPDAPDIGITLSSVEGANTNQSPFQVTIVFDEPVTGFELADINVTNGTAGNLAGSGDTYTVDITPTADGDVTVQVIGAGIADANTDIGRTVNDSDVLTVTYDTDAPEPAISSSASDPTTDSPIPLDIVFSEQSSGADDDVTGLTAADFTVVNGTAQNLVQVDGHTYTLEILPNDPPTTVQVTLPAGVCLDLAGNPNVVSNTFEITYQSAGDITAPTATLSSSATAVTNQSPITLQIDWNEAVSGFTVGDLQLSNCTASNFTQISSLQYTVELVPSGQGNFTAQVPAGVCQDSAGNNNDASSVFTREYDSQSPNPVITSTEADPTAASPIPIEIDFGEVVSGFEQADITISGGTIANFATADNQTFTFDVTPDSVQETITIDVAGGVCIDDAGNPNTAASQFSITYDTTGPIPTISSSESDPTNVSPVPIIVNFNEDVTGFDSTDITLANGTLSNFVAISASQYTFDVTPSGDPVTITVDINAAVCQDNLGNNNVAASQFEITYDTQVPIPVISSTVSDPTNISPVPIEVAFNEDVIGFEAGDVNVTGGTLGNFAQVDPQNYTFDITPASTEENITVDIPAGVCQDTSGNPNEAATQFAITYDAVGDQPVITSSESQYTQADPILLTITFSEAQIGFTVGDITVGNGTVDTFVDAGGGVYTCNLNPTANGACTIDIVGGVCTDQAGNNNVAADQFTIFHDTAAPTVSNATITFDQIDSDSGRANWIKAVDAVSAQADLVYKVYTSASNNIGTVADAELNGTLFATLTDANSDIIDGLTAAETIWVNVVVEDQAGNKLAYTQNSFTTNDDVAPTVPADDAITVGSLSTYGWISTFNKSIDNDTAQANLEYAGFTSLSNNLSDPATIEANGTIHGGWQTDPAQIEISGLDPETIYYHNIAVRDASGNISVYSTRAIETLPAADPYELSATLVTITPYQ